jgi:hypothetical protein
MPAASPLTRRGSDGVALAVKVTARARRDRILGLATDAAGAAWLSVSVTAPAEGGKANDAVLRLLARALGVPASALRLMGGAGARWKRLVVAGDPEALAARVEGLIGGPR